MKSKLYIKIFILSIGLCYFIGCSNKKYLTSFINSRWDLELPFQITEQNIVKDKLNSHGYIILKVSNKNISNFLENNLSIYNYTNWNREYEGIIIDDISIDKKDFICSMKKNTERFRIKGIFINPDNQKIIFVDYNWAGY